MRRILLRCAVFALCCAPVVAGAGVPQGVTFEVGGGYTGLDGGEGNRPGGGGFLGVSMPLRPWFSVGGELGGYGFGQPDPAVTYGTNLEYDRSTLFTLMATFHVRPPIRSGVGPFLVSQTGVALLRLGAGHQYSPWYPGEFTTLRPDDYVFCSAIGIGLRGTWPRPAPGFELGVRSVLLGGETPRTMIVPRLSLTY